MVKLNIVVIFTMGCVMGLLSLLIRSELSNPALSPVLSALGGDDPQALYESFVHLHGGLGTALFFFVASFLAFVARSKDARAAHVWGGIAVGLGALQILIAIWAFGHGVAPNFVPEISLIVHHHHTDAPQTWYQIILGEEFMQVTALTLTLLACASTLCISSAYRIGSALMMALTLCTFALYAFFFLKTHSDIGLSLYIMPEVVLLAILAIVLVDPNRVDQPYLTIGVSVVLVASLAFDLLSTMTDEQLQTDSYFYIANKHLAQHGLMVFAFFSAWSEWQNQTFDRGLEWLHAAAIALAFSLTYVPLMIIGRKGGMRFDLDTAATYSDLNYLSTLGAYSLIVLIAAGIFLPKYRKLRGQIVG
ncbi:hypothetical protein BVC71_04500 [Marivivens niveibacter]|uniref:Cytochrome oxidase subunit I profile domain-containing protein n=1 Tax=Marivivens niveibacter TaxID=1930667 RepID=A0A251X207_9RHOB|nr:hypothetical protein [Marivivens niveibacter]OUD10749.1 hypothetical protein BVC71_04500 [Marivivens niveibacter]